MAYRDCCVEASSESSFRSCPGCGTAIFRCAQRGCSGLADEFNHCPLCSSIEARYLVPGRIEEGESAAVRLRLKGTGKRPMVVERLRQQFRTDGQWSERETSLAIESGQEEDIVLDAFVPERAGSHPLLVEIGARVEFPGIDAPDRFHFSAESVLSVRSGERGKQEIHVHGGIHASGAAIVTIENKDFGRKRDDGPPPPADRWEELALRRDTTLDRREFRDDRGRVITRRTPILFVHVETGQQEVHTFHNGRLVFGRNRPEQDDGVDVLLRVFPYDSERNRELTEAISRRHFSLFPSSGRLWIRNHSSLGSSVNYRRLIKGAVSPLEDGDLISCFVEIGDVAVRSWEVRFSGSGEEATEVDLVPKW